VGVASKVMSWTPTRVLVPAIAWQHRLFEPELRKLDELAPKDRGAVDVGAGWGPWSWWLARRVPRVDSFERNLELVEILTPVLPSNVFLHPVALGDESGDLDLWVPSGGRGTEGSALFEASPAAESAWRQEVATNRLDDFDLGNVGFVRIDVGGNGLAVLNGATDLLISQRPTLLIEIEANGHGDGRLDMIIKFLHDLSYGGSYLHKGRWHSIEDLDRQTVRGAANRVAPHGNAACLSFYSRRSIHTFVFRPI
jgi:FkbM family methyltransferase